jgi:hypothetical protein
MPDQQERSNARLFQRKSFLWFIKPALLTNERPTDWRTPFTTKRQVLTNRLIPRPAWMGNAALLPKRPPGAL